MLSPPHNLFSPSAARVVMTLSYVILDTLKLWIISLVTTMAQDISERNRLLRQNSLIHA